MLINNKTVFVYDIEVFPNLFTCSVVNSESKKSKTYEISSRKNDLKELIKLFLNKNIMFCGYNNKHYDDPMINYLIINLGSLLYKSTYEITDELKKFSDKIINSETSASWSKYKYANNFESFDLLTMMFSQKLRCGLKELQVTMRYPKVQEYEGDFNQAVPDSEIDNVIHYNLNDINSTLCLLNKKKDDIDLRLGIEKEYGIKALSSDGVSIGTEILKTKYLQATGKSWNEIKDLRSTYDTIPLKDVILPKISFNTPLLQDLLKEMKTLTVDPGRNGWNKKFEFHGTVISIGVGGHSRPPKNCAKSAKLEKMYNYKNIIINVIIIQNTN